MKQIVIIVGLLIGVGLSCHKDQSLRPAVVREAAAGIYIDHLDELVRLDRTEQIDIDPNRLYESIQYPLLELTDVNQLRVYFYRCESEKQMARTDTHRRAVLTTAQEAILLRLSELPGTAAGEALVELYADRQLQLDPGLMLSLGEAMVARGEHIVAPLEKVKSVRPVFSHRVLECIATGRAFL